MNLKGWAPSAVVLAVVATIVGSILLSRTPNSGPQVVSGPAGLDLPDCGPAKDATSAVTISIGPTSPAPDATCYYATSNTNVTITIVNALNVPGAGNLPVTLYISPVSDPAIVPYNASPDARGSFWGGGTSEKTTLFANLIPVGELKTFAIDGLAAGTYVVQSERMPEEPSLLVVESA